MKNKCIIRFHEPDLFLLFGKSCKTFRTRTRARLTRGWESKTSPYLTVFLRVHRWRTDKPHKIFDGQTRLQHENATLSLFVRWCQQFCFHLNAFGLFPFHDVYFFANSFLRILSMCLLVIDTYQLFCGYSSCFSG